MPCRIDDELIYIPILVDLQKTAFFSLNFLVETKTFIYYLNKYLVSEGNFLPTIISLDSFSKKWFSTSHYFSTR